jgi:hypothetical protein
MPPFVEDLLWSWGFLLVCTAPWLLLLLACVAAWRRGRWRPAALLVGLVLVAPLGVCGWEGANLVEREVEQFRIARAMGVALTDPRLDFTFPGGFVVAAAVPGRTTREQVRALVPRARARYGCPNYDVVFFFSESPRGVFRSYQVGDAVVVNYDRADQVREAYVVDSLVPSLDRCARF